MLKRKIRINALELISALTSPKGDLEAIAERHGCTASELREALKKGSWKVVPGCAEEDM